MPEALRSLARRVIPATLRQKLRAAWRKVRYFGFRFECPFCRGRFRKFLPYGSLHAVLKEQNVVGARHRANALCPCCLSMDRERLVYLYLKRKTPVLREPVRLLHVAPLPNLRAVLRASENIDYLAANLQADDAMLRMDVTDIRHPAGSFDVILCNHVLEHVPDDRKAMAEILRTLKPGGWAILQVPISRSLPGTREDPAIADPSRREAAFGQADHVRLYGGDYPQRLRDAGFVVEEFEWALDDADFGGPANRFALDPLETLYRAVKPRDPD